MPKSLCHRSAVQGMDLGQARHPGTERHVLAQERDPAARAESKHGVRCKSRTECRALKRITVGNPMSEILTRVFGKLIRSSVLLAASALLTDAVLPVTPALADRPGTPNGVALSLCGDDPSSKPGVCGTFLNTANEEVRFEIDFVIKDRNRVSTPIGCPLQGMCWMPSQPYKRSQTRYEDNGRDRPLNFRINDLEFDTTWCRRYGLPPAASGRRDRQALPGFRNSRSRSRKPARPSRTGRQCRTSSACHTSSCPARAR